MDITPLIPEGNQIIQSYASGLFRVNGTAYQEPVIVFPDRVVPWSIGGDCFQIEDFSDIFEWANDVDVLLLGCGRSGQFIDPELRQAFRDHNIILEAMDSGAACRTYNVLMAEGRKVAAALLLV